MIYSYQKPIYPRPFRDVWPMWIPWKRRRGKVVTDWYKFCSRWDALKLELGIHKQYFLYEHLDLSK